MSAKIRFTMIDGPMKGQAFVFEQHDLLLFGRSQDSHLRLPKEDTTASRDHFILELNPPYARVRYVHRDIKPANILGGLVGKLALWNGWLY